DRQRVPLVDLAVHAAADHDAALVVHGDGIAGIRTADVDRAVPVAVERGVELTPRRHAQRDDVGVRARERTGRVAAGPGRDEPTAVELEPAGRRLPGLEPGEEP